MKGGIIYQFKITLLAISPVIWRRIQVPESYTFWDLHVAIQDAMGWLDYHLHVFRFDGAEGRRAIDVGIPDEDNPRDAIIPGWTAGIADRFIRPGMFATYEYDFGDGWIHKVLLEGILLAEAKAKYPKCLAGERACPPEDCGGVPGYMSLLKILRNRRHPDYAEYTNWLSGQARKNRPFDPTRFDPADVRFMNPKKRLGKAVSGMTK